MPPVNLKGQLSTLVRLQELDTRIYGLSEEKREKPAEIETLKAAFEAKKKRMAELEKALVDAQKEKKDHEIELGSKEENVKKLQSQLYALKTNKEYNAMLQQIADAKADASMIEDKILGSMDKIDSTKIAVDEEKKRLQQEESVFNAEKQKVETRIKEIEQQLETLENQRRQITPEVDQKILQQYERILRSREGLAIVKVKNDSCSGCNMAVPPQVINLIRMFERMITCEVCNRILCIDDEPEAS